MGRMQATERAEESEGVWNRTGQARPGKSVVVVCVYVPTAPEKQLGREICCMSTNLSPALLLLGSEGERETGLNRYSARNKLMQG